MPAKKQDGGGGYSGGSSGSAPRFYNLPKTPKGSGPGNTRKATTTNKTKAIKTVKTVAKSKPVKLVYKYTWGGKTAKINTGIWAASSAYDKANKKKKKP